MKTRLMIFFIVATNSCSTLANISCIPTDQPQNADMFYQYLIYNYKRHSSSSIGRRSPWIIELDFAWLSRPREPRLDGLLRFIKLIVNNPKYRHVYFVSIERALEWMKYPRPINDLRDFWAFRCSDTPQKYSIDCGYQTLHDADEDSLAMKSKIEGLKSDNDSNSSETELVDRQSEKLFPSSIAFHLLWIFLLVILSVLFYDKYFATK